MNWTSLTNKSYSSLWRRLVDIISLWQVIRNITNFFQCQAYLFWTSFIKLSRPTTLPSKLCFNRDVKTLELQGYWFIQSCLPFDHMSLESRSVSRHCPWLSLAMTGMNYQLISQFPIPKLHQVYHWKKCNCDLIYNFPSFLSIDRKRLTMKRMLTCKIFAPPFLNTRNKIFWPN